MKYRKFGRTNKNISVISLGGGFGGLEFNSQKDIDKCVELVIAASKKGINYFDTAPTYAKGKSETIFGLAFKHISNEYYVSTKSRFEMDPSADALRCRLECSLNSLGTEKIHFYHIWSVMNAEHYKNVKKPGGPLEGALKAKEEGLIEHLCVSLHCSSELTEIIINDGYFDGITIGYNILQDRFREKEIEIAYEKGFGIAIMNPLNGGIIPRNPEIFSYIKKFEDDTVSAAALRYIIHNREVTTILSGMTNIEELNENLKAVEDERVLDEKYLENIRQSNPIKNKMLCTGCGYCLVCPDKIEIDRLMREYDRQKLLNYDLEEFYLRLKYNHGFHFGQLFNCKGCGLCEKRCTQHIPIIKRIQEINTYNQKLRNFLEFLEPNVAIYGTGSFAQDIIQRYEDAFGKIDFNIFIFDSNPEKWGTCFYNNFRVYSPNEIIKFGIKKMIIATKAYYEEIYEKLKHLEKNGVTFIFPY